MYDHTMADSPFLQLTDCLVDIGDQRLLEIKQLSLRSEGITVVMGPNGAGKSMMLRVLHGLVEPMLGEVHIKGVPMSRVARLRQSLVFQSPVLLRRTAEANVRFVLKSRGLPLDRAGQLLDRVRLGDKADSQARRLSGGEKQRLAIAQALATEPDVLLLDEPTASLDPTSTKMIEDILHATIAQDVRVVMVSHDAMQARRLADEIVFLSNGRVLEQSPALDFFDAPKTIAAKAYLAGRLVT